MDTQAQDINNVFGINCLNTINIATTPRCLYVRGEVLNVSTHVYILDTNVAERCLKQTNILKYSSYQASVFKGAPTPCIRNI